MIQKNFFPRSEALQISWLTQYITKLPIYASFCGIPDAEVADTTTDITYYIWLLQHWHPNIQNHAKEATLYKQLMGNGGEKIQCPTPIAFPDAPKMPEPGILKRLFSQIARIKASINYNDTIGQDLGIKSIANNGDHPIPEFTASAEMGEKGQRVRINFKKYDHKGIWIETRINGDEWKFLDKTIAKPYFDETPFSNGNNHETREYRLRWWDGSSPYGEWSIIQRVVLGL